MKLLMTKIISMLLPVIGVFSIFIFAFTGHIGWGFTAFIISMFVSEIIAVIFFRCPHCHRAIPASGNLNQKYCPYCGEELGMKPLGISYYGKCTRSKDGALKAYTMIVPMVFIVSTMIVLLIVVAILGLDSIFQGIGRILVLAAFVMGILIGMLCRLAVGSVVKMDDEKIYFSKVPFRWTEYELDDIKEQAKMAAPFYDRRKGYIVTTSKGKLMLPVTMYKGGQEFLKEFTKRICQPMPDIRPELELVKEQDKNCGKNI